MPKIERRRTSVTLYQGNYEHELGKLSDEMLEAFREEESNPGQRRHGTRSKANTLARKYDKLRKEADATAVEVVLWAIRYDEWGPLADDHAPREDEAADKMHGVNLETFPPVLLLASLVEPDGTNRPRSPDELIAKGQAVLDDIGVESKLHHAKLERAAWNVNTGDDALPKFSAVSVLTRLRDPDSSQPEPGE